MCACFRVAQWETLFWWQFEIILSHKPYTVTFHMTAEDILESLTPDADSTHLLVLSFSHTCPPHYPQFLILLNTLMLCINVYSTTSYRTYLLPIRILGLHMSHLFLNSLIMTLSCLLSFTSIALHPLCNGPSRPFINRCRLPGFGTPTLSTMVHPYRTQPLPHNTLEEGEVIPFACQAGPFFAPSLTQLNVPQFPISPPITLPIPTTSAHLQVSPHLQTICCLFLSQMMISPCALAMGMSCLLTSSGSS